MKIHKLLIATIVSILALAIPAISYAALGDILYGSSNPSINNRLTIGANATCLTSNGSIPGWSACASGGGGAGTFSTTSPYGTTLVQYPYTSLFTSLDTSATSTSGWWYSPTTKTFNAVYGSTTALTVSGNAYVAGNVGIGTTSPYQTLSVNGSAVVTGNTTLATTTISNLNGVIVVDGVKYAKTGLGVASAVSDCKNIGATCGGVYAPAGIYSFSSALTIYSGLNLSGASASTTIFKLVNGANTNLITSPATGIDSVHISNITFDGNGTNQASGGDSSALLNFQGHGILMKDIYVDHVVVENAYGSCVFFTGDNYTNNDNYPKSVSNSRVFNCGVGTTGFGLYVDYAPNTTFAYNTIDTVSGDDAIEIGHLGNAHVIGNSILSGELQFPFGSNSDIVDNWIYNTTIQNDANKADDMVIVGNHVLNATPTTGYAGIALYGASSTISNNVVYTNSFSGIRVSGGDGDIITDNQIISTSTNGVNGIYLQTSNGHIVQGNRVDGFLKGIDITSDNNNVSNNTIENSGTGIYFSDSSISGHTMNGNYVAMNQMINVTTPVNKNNQTNTSNEIVSIFNGNTGIGSSTPMGRLTVQFASTSPVLMVNQTGTGSLFKAQYNGADIFSVNSNNALVTPNNYFELQHTGGDAFFGLFMRADTTSNQYTFNSDSGVGSYKSIDFQGQGTSLLHIHSNGNIGIGTTSPYAPLSVVGTGGVVAESFTATSTTANSTFAGNVGIATSTPTTTLDVNGAILTEEITPATSTSMTIHMAGANATSSERIGVGTSNMTINIVDITAGAIWSPAICETMGTLQGSTTLTSPTGWTIHPPNGASWGTSVVLPTTMIAGWCDKFQMTADLGTSSPLGSGTPFISVQQNSAY